MGVAKRLELSHDELGHTEAFGSTNPLQLHLTWALKTTAREVGADKVETDPRNILGVLQFQDNLAA